MAGTGDSGFIVRELDTYNRIVRWQEEANKKSFYYVMKQALKPSKRDGTSREDF